MELYTVFKTEGTKSQNLSRGMLLLWLLTPNMWVTPAGIAYQYRFIYTVNAPLPASHKYAHNQNKHDSSEHPKEDIQYFALARGAIGGFCRFDHIKVESTRARDLFAQRPAQISAELLNNSQQNVLV